MSVGCPLISLPVWLVLDNRFLEKQSCSDGCPWIEKLLTTSLKINKIGPRNIMCLHTLCKVFSSYLSQARRGHIWHNGSGNWFCHRRCPVSWKSSQWIQSPQEGGVRARWQCFWVFRNGAWNGMQVGYIWNDLPQLPEPYSRHKRNRQQTDLTNNIRTSN